MQVILNSNVKKICKLDLEETYPASKQSSFQDRLDRFEQIHESSNWNNVEYDGWKLPGNEFPHDWCGRWATKGCMYLEYHKKSEHVGKIFIKHFQKSCYRACCELCKKRWMIREANKATRRIQKYQETSDEHAKHIIISVPDWEKYKPVKELRKRAYEILKEVGAKGGTAIFHPFRYNKDLKLWYYSPHFHILGFGWISCVVEAYNKHGWIIKNKGVRDSIFATFLYQLSHAGIKKRNHTLTWFGDLSYSKLKVENEPDPDLCPICSSKLVEIRFVGTLHNWIPPPEVYFEMFVSPDGWQLSNVLV
jgi:hypothetical protein